ncbi:MAG: arylsulfatase [Planctomycetes bacterium]|nr:arylsulfatase [Planctomycetota bacterium]
MNIRISCNFLWIFFLFALCAYGEKRPNILLIMVDDLGYADFGCYGGEIATPNIDQLASKGLRFTQFYNTAKCHSSRVSLLTGLYCNQAGSSKLSRATTLAQVTSKAGYFTSMAGKWHLKNEPTDFGFQRYWGHLSGATDFFVGDKTFRLNGEPWNDFVDGFYVTDANVDYSIKFLDEAIASKKPFFHYIAFNAPHYPLQAKKEDIKKYLGRYDAGWEVIRKERFAKQKKLGLLPKETTLPPLPKHVPAWDSLTDKQRELESFRMAVFAAMVDSVDQNMGRLIDYLKENEAYDNTLIMLLSDNGACPFERSRNLDIPPWKGNSFLLYDASWATVGNTPFKHYKQTQHEGGISTPFIAHWPKGIQSTGGYERMPSHLVDVMATVLELSDGIYPKNDIVQPMQGKSLTPFFKGQSREPHDELYFEFGSCRALRQGDWKVASFYGCQWELYNIKEDRIEQNNLAKQHPERVKAMAERWTEIAKTKDFQGKKKYSPVKLQESSNVNKTWHDPKKVEKWKMPDM